MENKTNQIIFISIIFILFFLTLAILMPKFSLVTLNNIFNYAAYRIVYISGLRPWLVKAVLISTFLFLCWLPLAKLLRASGCVCQRGLSTRRSFRLFALATIALFMATIACCERKTTSSPTGDQAGLKIQPVGRVGPRGVLYRGVETIISEPEELSEAEAKRKAVALQMDRKGLLTTSKVVEDRNERMLKAPESVQPFIGREIHVANEAPLIEFAIVPVKPQFFSEAPPGNRIGPWSNWSQATFYSKTGKFYSAVGDHGAYDAHLYIVEYDPARKVVRCLPEVNAVLGRKKNQFGEGKIHGWLDFYPPGSPNLWFCTYWAKYPEPEEEDYTTGYDGGHIMSLNVENGDIVDYGVPLKRASWPYHRVDTKRGIMYAVGMFGEFLAWDINEQKVLWAGYLPDGIKWWNRAIMIDEQTGFVYTTNKSAEDKEIHFIKYDPWKNRFFKLECTMPFDPPAKAGRLPERSQMRAQTSHRGPDGLFWGVSRNGELFSFDPEKEKVIDRGVNWPGKERYTCSMVRSPKGRYIYYLPGAHGMSFAEGAPVVQYDTLSGEKKVLAFLHPYYYDKYGYTMGGTFSIALDDSGAKLFILMNGAFIDLEEQIKLQNPDVFGNPSILLIHIPESERIE